MADLIRHDKRKVVLPEKAGVSLILGEIDDSTIYIGVIDIVQGLVNKHGKCPAFYFFSR